MAEKKERWTIASMTELLNLADIEIPKTCKLAKDIRLLCEQHKLIARPPPEFKDVNQICVVKCALRTAMNLNDVQYALFREQVDSMVNVISRMLRRASLILSFHVTDLANADRPIPNLYKMKDTYWKQWLKIGIDGIYPDAASKETFKRIEKYVDKVLDPDSKDPHMFVKEFPTCCEFDQVLNYAGHLLRTVVTNNAWVPLFNRLARLTKHTLIDMKLSNIKAFHVVQAIRSEEAEQEATKFPVVVQDYITEVRRRLDATPKVRIYDNYGHKEVTFNTMLRFNFWMQTQFESLSQRRLKLMPVFSVGRAHIHLDQRTLLQLIKKLLSNYPEKRKKEVSEALHNIDSRNDDNRNPNLTFLEEVKKTKPEEKKKKDCESDQEWEDYKIQQQEYQDRVKEIKKSDVYTQQQVKYDIFIESQRQVTSMLFHHRFIQKKKKKGWKFDCSVATDGVSISMQYSRTARVLCQKAKKAKTVKKQPVKKTTKKEKVGKKTKTTKKDKTVKQNADKKSDKETNKDATTPEPEPEPEPVPEAEPEPEAKLGTINYDRDLTTDVHVDNEDIIVLGLDPGRNNLAAITYYIKDKHGEGHTNSWSLTRGEYYTRSGIKSRTKAKARRYKHLQSRWRELGGETIGLRTSSVDHIQAYLIKYAEFSNEWWQLALNRTDSRDKLHVYAGKRSVIDTFYCGIMKYMDKTFPGYRVEVAYGSAYTTMKPTGPGEVAAPVGEMYKACQRIMTKTTPTWEFRSTMVGWQYGTKKELVYKTFRVDSNGKQWESLHHTSDKYAPFMLQVDKESVDAYINRKKHQGVLRRGGNGSTEQEVLQEEDEKKNAFTKKQRYPEVRGLRFCPESCMYLDRDRESALTIARLRCMELKGLPRPFPFDARYEFPAEVQSPPNKQ